MVRIGRETRTPAADCPWCGATHDCAALINPAEPQAVPKPGDFSLCIKCASPVAFDESLRLRKATPAEERMLNRDPVYARTRRAVLHLDRKAG